MIPTQGHKKTGVHMLMENKYNTCTHEHKIISLDPYSKM